MLDSMRQASSGWVAKILLGLLILSFAVWGISEQFFGYRGDVVAQVGDREVTAQAFDIALRQRMQQISQQTGRAMTLEQARAFGLPNQVLNTLIAEAALENQGDQYNLGVSEDTLADQVAQDPVFSGPGGRFDANRFQAIIRNAGMTEDTYFRDLEGGLVRNQIVSAVAGDVAAPTPMIEAIYRFQTEERNFSFLIIDENAIDPIGDPDEETLRTYFGQNEGTFRAPEFRRVGLIQINPELVSDPNAISDADARAYYEERTSDFVAPEQRRVLQIRYPSETEAQKANTELTSGATFQALLESRGVSEADVDLGLRDKQSIVDPQVAEAAFNANLNEIVYVPDGRFGPAIVTVTEIQGDAVSAFEDVEEAVRKAMADEDGEDTVLNLYDEIEDERAAGSTLEEVANKLGQTYVRPEPFAADSSTQSGGTSDTPGSAFLIADAFESDVGVENDPIRIGDNNYIFYEVLETIPSRDRTFEEARDDVARAWRADESADRISARSAELVDRIRNGETMAAVAQDLGQSIYTRQGITRNNTSSGVSANAIAQVFGGPKGHVANADADRPPNQYIVQVDDIIVPAYFEEAQEAQATKQQLDRMMQADILGAYTAYLLDNNDTFVNNTIFQIVTGERVVDQNNARRTTF